MEKTLDFNAKLLKFLGQNPDSITQILAHLNSTNEQDSAVTCVKEVVKFLLGSHYLSNNNLETALEGMTGPERLEYASTREKFAQTQFTAIANIFAPFAELLPDVTALLKVYLANVKHAAELNPSVVKIQHKASEVRAETLLTIAKAEKAEAQLRLLEVSAKLAAAELEAKG